MAGASQGLRAVVAYDGIGAGLERLRSDGWLIVQTAAAAAMAWLLAAAVLHHQQAGFAPIGAVIAVEVTRGQQVRHAIELVLGVTLGIGVAVLVGSMIGSPPLRIAVVVGVAMTLALLVSGSLVLVVQASLAAIFLAATPSSTGGLAGEHLVEALIGRGLALVMTQLLFLWIPSSTSTRPPNRSSTGSPRPWNRPRPGWRSVTVIGPGRPWSKRGPSTRWCAASSRPSPLATRSPAWPVPPLGAGRA